MASERLQLLLSIKPLLNPTLPSPPPSPTLEEAPPLPTTAGQSPSRKQPHPRPHDPQPLGLGLEGTGVATPDPKRPRSSPPKVPIAITPILRSTPRLKPFAPSPLLRSPALGPTYPGAASPSNPPDDWKRHFPKERLRKLAAAYREQGRTLKHSGDRVAREAKTAKDGTLAAVLQMEAIFLYVFAFWCDDQASRNCLVANWQSIFGLLAFVKRAAEKQGLAVISGLCLKVEALTCQILSTHEQKSLNYKGVQYAAAVAGPSPSNSGHHGAAPSPAGSHHTAPSSAGSPPNIASSLYPPPPNSHSSHPSHPPPSPPATDLVRNFTSASSALFRISRLVADSNAILSPALMKEFLPRTWHACTAENVGVDPGGVVVPTKQAAGGGEEGEVVEGGRWVFGWPVELSSVTAAPHVVGWGRGLLEEWAQAEGCGYKATEVKE